MAVTRDAARRRRRSSSRSSPSRGKAARWTLRWDPAPRKSGTLGVVDAAARGVRPARGGCAGRARDEPPARDFARAREPRRVRDRPRRAPGFGPARSRAVIPRPTRMTSTPSQRRSPRRTCFGTSRSRTRPRALRAGPAREPLPGLGAMTTRPRSRRSAWRGRARRVPATSPRTGPRRRTCGTRRRTPRTKPTPGSRSATHGDARVLRHAPNESSNESSLASCSRRLRHAATSRRDACGARCASTGAPSTWACTCSRAARRARTDGERRRELDGSIHGRRFFPARAATSRWKNRRADCPVRRGLGGVRVRRDPASLRGGRARGGRPARPRVPGGVGRADARSTSGRVPNMTRRRRARARARVLDARYGAGGGGGQGRATETIVAAMDAAAPFVASAIHDANANASGTPRTCAPLPDRAAHFFETFRFDFVLDDGSASADGLPDPVARRGERVAHLRPPAAARRRPVPALRRLAA